MKIFAVIFFCWTIILVSGLSTEAAPPEPLITTSKPNTTVTPPNTSTTSPTTPPTSPPTASPKTPPTTPPTTPRTTPPTTPRKTPPTTPRTTPPTTPPTTTASPPTPSPPAKPGQWIVNHSNKTCIVVAMAAKFSLVYPTTNNLTKSVEITLPSDNKTAVANGTCIEGEQIMNITWPSKENATKNYLLLHFVKNGSDAYSLHHIELYPALSELPMINVTSSPVMFIHNHSEYRTGLANSYKCAKLQNISLTSNVSKASGMFEVSDLQFRAFKDDATNEFGYAEDCAYEVRDVVPIAVGCALIVLIVIVLVAYLVGRRRSQARGYLSM